MINDELRSILPLAGWSEERVRSVEVAGALDPILPTPFRITATGTAALAAVGLAAADLWEVRTGRRQKVAINTRHATASLRSGRYLKMGEKEVDFGRNPVVGIYPSKNGRWNYLH